MSLKKSSSHKRSRKTTTMTLRRSLMTSCRGDTIIEVILALTIFSLVTVITITMMNLGIANAENALEVTTARNELNAQAEALRFIHSSYISEKTLPTYNDLTQSQIDAGEKYQQYAELWNTIISNAINPLDAANIGILDLAGTVNDKDTTDTIFNTNGCSRVYENTTSGTLLSRSHAFVLNTRDLSSLTSSGRINIDLSYVSARTHPEVFTEAPLNARIIYTSANNPGAGDSTTQFTDGGIIYDRVARAEGIWVVAVTDGSSMPEYYDFYIETCWYGPNTRNPSALDTVIRLYNPENV